uniref:Uncharacterized protein n=1 Tax=Chromera velia CCMP2878 TaxID=1169474 RepID=A0A0G4H939_9ALVE|eukprot:Cvel_25307.t1-p1 / transcript=Cvel_25307.t1 / gene=Cvel_25307 / organism=Chromera_velia_CCMP2878 / gene_product=hypothetical protein / transcript_product=hypothetical protein / location=Cvel_scaffold2848:3300-10385(+) / protein_length=524 / sequence_SO=supercontig / SO=protein_coding / is_pseudo=false
MTGEPKKQSRKEELLLKKANLLQADGFIPKVSKSLPLDLRRKLFFTTSHETDFPGADPVSKQDHRGQTCSKIHAYKPKWRGGSAPFWQRDANCRYNQDFVPLPLLGATINKELAKTFAPPNVPPNSALRLQGKTSYGHQFPGWRGMFRPDNYKPEVEVHVSDKAKLMRVKMDAFTPIEMSATSALPLTGQTHYVDEFCKEPDGKDRRRENLKAWINKYANTSRVIGSQVPEFVRSADWKRKQQETRMKCSASTPAFLQVDFQWLLEHPEIDPFDAEFDRTWKAGLYKEAGPRTQILLVDEDAAEGETGAEGGEEGVGVDSGDENLNGNGVGEETGGDSGECESSKHHGEGREEGHAAAPGGGREGRGAPSAAPVRPQTAAGSQRTYREGLGGEPLTARSGPPRSVCCHCRGTGAAPFSSAASAASGAALVRPRTAGGSSAILRTHLLLKSRGNLRSRGNLMDSQLASQQQQQQKEIQRPRTALERAYGGRRPNTRGGEREPRRPPTAQQVMNLMRPQSQGGWRH